MAYRKRNKQLDLAKYKENSKKDLISAVDLEYPQKLHDLHNDYPLASDKNESNKREKINISIGQVYKLIPTLNKKETYVLHYRNSQLYTDLTLRKELKLKTRSKKTSSN